LTKNTGDLAKNLQRSHKKPPELQKKISRDFTQLQRTTYLTPKVIFEKPKEELTKSKGAFG
jgi:hypothetical protein